MFDVAIVGGGLAGSNAAITLGQRNRHVLLLEAHPYPHPKVCGEFLSPECLSLFASSGFLSVLQKLHPVTIGTVRITAPDGSAWSTKFPAPALGISRYALDAAFARYISQQGVEVHDGMRVTEITGSLREGFALTARTSTGIQVFHAATVISAHGKRSNLDRYLRRAFLRQSQPYLALKRHFRGPSHPGQIDLYVFPGGYCGMSQVEGGVMNVCLLVRQDVFQNTPSDHEASVEAFIRWMSKQNRYLRDWFAQATAVYPSWLSIAQVPFADKTSIEGDILLAGDAAGMIAPLAGDGMAMALHSGELAALLIDRYLDGEIAAPELKTAYAQAWNAAFKRRLHLARILQSMLLRPSLLVPGLRLLNRLPALGSFLVAQTRDLGLVER